MNKKLLILGIAILLLTVGLSGCIDSQSDYVTIQGLLIAAPMDGNKAGFYIIEGFSAEIWLCLWNESCDYDYGSDEDFKNHVFILTKNGEMITEEYDNYSVKLDGKYEYLDVINVTGIVGTIVRDDYNDTMNSIEVKSIEMVKKFENPFK